MVSVNMWNVQFINFQDIQQRVITLKHLIVKDTYKNYGEEPLSKLPRKQNWCHSRYYALFCNRSRTFTKSQKFP